MKAKKYVTYAKKSFVMIEIKKANMLFIIESEMIAITPGNLEELLIIFAIEDAKYLKQFLLYFIMVQYMIITS